MEADETPKPKKKTRRGSRGGRNRKKKTATAEAAAGPEADGDGEAKESPESSRAVTIHVPGDELGREGAVEQVEASPVEPEATNEPTTAEAEGEPAPAAKKKTRRGSRGGRNRKKKPAAATNGADAAAGVEEPAQAEEPSTNGDFDYVPMSEWGDELETNR